MKNGFTLLELSIVLVIIGLIIGGITAGSSLIRSAEIQSISKEITKYNVAVNTFRLKYNRQLPGDMANAVDYWGAAVTNGTGDGVFSATEGFKFWTHMAESEIISGNFTGVSGPDNPSWDAVIGSNVPETSISGVGIFPLSLVYGGAGAIPRIDPTVTTGFEYTTNQFNIGRDNLTQWTLGAFLTPAEMKSLDEKIDDGKPGTGSIIANLFNTCTDAADAIEAASSTANYELSTTTEACSIIVMPKMNGL